MLLAILSICSKEELEDQEAEESKMNFLLRLKILLVSEADLRKQVIRNKIKAVGRMARVFATLRQEKESIMELKNVLGVTTLPPGTLADGVEGIKQGTICSVEFPFKYVIAIQSFEEAKKADLENERLPPIKDGSHASMPSPSVFGKVLTDEKKTTRVNPLKIDGASH